MDSDKNLRTALEILDDEVRGDVAAALSKMSDDYTMTWMYSAPKTGTLFPRTKPDFRAEMKEVYKIEGRRYDVKNAVASDTAVMVEMVESYPDEDGKEFRTPLVIVLEFDAAGKIRKGRHYCDPNISYLKLEKSQIDQAFSG